MQEQIQLSQKERMLLSDDKKQEDLCVAKYKNYSGQAEDPLLKKLFTTISSEEQHHYDMIDQMLQGKQPDMAEPKQSEQSYQAPPSKQQEASKTPQSNFQGAMGNTGDKMLCNDLLATEKFVSGTYDTGIFEAANPTVRQTLQHIQRDEQRHGEELFNYMHSHGMYEVQ